MANYHVNLKTGKTGICKADPGKCPVQATDGAEHFDNKNDAQSRAEEVLTKKSGVMKSAVKADSGDNEKIAERDINAISDLAENENNPIKDPKVQENILAELKGSGLIKENLSKQELLAVAVSVAHPRILTLNADGLRPYNGAAKIIFDNTPREKFLEKLNEFNNKESQQVMRLDKTPKRIDGKPVIPQRVGRLAVEKDMGYGSLSEEYSNENLAKTDNEIALQEDTQSAGEKFSGQ